MKNLFLVSYNTQKQELECSFSDGGFKIHKNVNKKLYNSLVKSRDINKQYSLQFKKRGSK